MAVSEQRRAATAPLDQAYPRAVNVGPIGRLGRYTATHFRYLPHWLDRALPSVTFGHA